MRESELQDKVQKELNGRGVSWKHIPGTVVKKHRQLAGLPDLICVGYGCCFFIELKSDKGLLSEKQKEYLYFARTKGVPVLITNEFTDVVIFLDELRDEYRRETNRLS
jgi:hypothetical protein